LPKIIDLDTDEKIHHGRREKLRRRFMEHGLESFNETEVLEYSLGLAIPRIDTNPTAHRLVKMFGSLEGVIEAHPKKLQEVGGIGPQAAIFLSFQRQFLTYYAKRKQDVTFLKNHEAVVNYLSPIMQTFSKEEFLLVCLDRNGKILLQEQISGGLGHVDISIRNVIDMILRVKASAVIFAHNHIDGGINPSNSDILFTRTMVNMLAPMEINLIDHLIFGKDKEEFFSFSQEQSFGNKSMLELFKKEQKGYALSRDWQDV